MSYSQKEEGVSLSRASILVFIIGLGSKGLGFVREIVFAAKFGVKHEYDIFLTASVVPLILSVSIFYISQNFIIPFYNKNDLSKDQETSGSVQNTLLLYALIISSVLAVTLLIFANSFLSFYFGKPAETLSKIAFDVYIIYCLLLIPTTVVSVYSAYLLARFDYKNSQLNQVIPTIFIIGGSLLFGSFFGVRVIPFSLVLGTIAQLIFLYLVLTPRILTPLKPFNYFYGRFGDLFFYTVMIEVIGQLYVIIDRGFIENLPQGAISSLNYATNIFSLPITLISIAITTVIFPKVSKDYYSGNNPELLNLIIKSLRINLYLILMVAFVFVIYGEVIVRLLFQRGEFDAGATEMTSQVLVYLTYGLVFYALYSTLNRVCYGIGRAKFLFIITLVAIPIKWALNHLFLGALAQNGLALSTAITYTFLFISTEAYLTRELKSHFWKYILKDFIILTIFLSVIVLSVRIIIGIFSFTFSLEAFSVILFIGASYLFSLAFGIEPGGYIYSRLKEVNRFKFSGS